MNPLVLLGGMNCSADLWSDCDFGDVIVPPLEYETVDDQVEALIRDLPDRFVLVGLSLGGIVAMALAVVAPDRVAGLCLASTNAKAPTSEQRDGWLAWRHRLDDGESPRDLQDGIMSVLLSGPARRERSELIERTRRMGDDTGAVRLRAQLRMQASRTDLRPLLSELTMPALVVSGREDQLCPPSFHAEIVRKLPHAELVPIDTGHLVPLERPRSFSESLRGWRERHGI